MQAGFTPLPLQAKVKQTKNPAQKCITMYNLEIFFFNLGPLQQVQVFTLCQWKAECPQVFFGLKICYS